MSAFWRCHGLAGSTAPGMGGSKAAARECPGGTASPSPSPATSPACSGPTIRRLRAATASPHSGGRCTSRTSTAFAPTPARPRGRGGEQAPGAYAASRAGGARQAALPVSAEHGRRTPHSGQGASPMPLSWGIARHSGDAGIRHKEVDLECCRPWPGFLRHPCLDDKPRMP